MEMILKIAACGIISVILAAQIKTTSQGMAVLLSVAACVLILGLGFGFFSPIISFVERMSREAAIDSSLMTSLYRVCGSLRHVHGQYTV